MHNKLSKINRMSLFVQSDKMASLDLGGNSTAASIEFAAPPPKHPTKALARWVCFQCFGLVYHIIFAFLFELENLSWQDFLVVAVIIPPQVRRHLPDSAGIFAPHPTL